MSDQRQTSSARHARILELAAHTAFVRPTDLAAELGVSAETIRRDLLVLEDAGRVRRVHGGALSLDRRDTIPARDDRRVAQRKQKQEIGAIVASLVSDGDVLLMEIGTTMEMAARALPSGWSGTVVTNSLAVGAILNDRPSVDLQVLGGRVRLGEMNTFGPDALTQLAGINATIAFLAVGGVSVEAGLTDYYPEDVAVKHLMMRRATRTYALADSNKLEIRTTRSVCNLADVDAIITDSSADGGSLERLRARGATVLTQPQR
ncbi:DeoR/GlpR family DNA-binding transcription regulator [Microbacterium keratanolyticum]|uniref:DeoR/GlpR family DNA-binding transcription regulator n=1 Tax=Microbacterium keratanolyticum TaxID=67574 RepID=UPI003634150F